MLLRHSLLLAVLLASGCRGQLLSNEDNPPLIDRLLQVLWEPSSLIRWWTALDQMYNVALGWRRAARSVVNLPFQGRAMEDHVTFQAPRWSKRKADLPHWERFKKVYEPYRPDVPEAQTPPESPFRPREVFVGGLDLKDLATIASGNILQERGGKVPPHLPGADFLGLLQALAGQGKGLSPLGSVNMADMGTLASFIDYKNAHSGQGLVQRGAEHRPQGPGGQYPLGLNMEDLKVLAAFTDLENQRNFKDMLRAQNGKEGFRPDLSNWASVVESQKHFKDLPHTQGGKGSDLNKDYLRDMASALERQKHLKDLFQAQNTKEGHGSLNKDYLKDMASTLERQKHFKDLFQAQNTKEGHGSLNKDYLKDMASVVESQKHFKDLFQAQNTKEGHGSLNKDNLKDMTSAVESPKHFKDLFQTQNTKEGHGSLNKDYLKAWASGVESQKHLKNLTKAQNSKEGPDGLNKEYLKAWISGPEGQKYLKDMIKAQISKGGLNKEHLKAWALSVAHKHNNKDLAQSQSMKEARKTHPGGSFDMADYGLVRQPTPEKVHFLKSPDVPLPNPLFNSHNQGGHLSSPFGLSNVRLNAADIAKLKSLRPSGGQAPQTFAPHPPSGGPPPMFFDSTPDPQTKLRLFLNLMQKLGEGRVNPLHFDDERS